MDSSFLATCDHEHSLEVIARSDELAQECIQYVLHETCQDMT